MTQLEYVKARIEMIENYLESNSTPKNKEVGVGGSYVRHRNSRLSGLQATHISEFESELIQRKKQLIELTK